MVRERYYQNIKEVHETIELLNIKIIQVEPFVLINDRVNNITIYHVFVYS